MDEGGQLAAEYSSKQSKETQLAHKADRKLSNQAVHAEQAWAGGRSEDKWGNRHRTAKKKEAHKTAHPNATRPKNRERQHKGGGRKATASTKERRKTKPGAKHKAKKKDGEQGRRRADPGLRSRDTLSKEEKDKKKVGTRRH